MKKTILILLIGLTLSIGVGIAMYSIVAEIKVIDYVIYAAVGLIVLFSLTIAFKRLKDDKKGLVTEDELSRKIYLKAAAYAFMGSIYLWFIILLFTSDSNIDIEIVLGIGIVGMALIFIGFWVYYNNKGIDSENSN
jgi:archaellum biogenesis protein FlaJ (TadC family)